MKTRTNMELFGCIIKEEQLISLDKDITPGTCVLKGIKPFSGYYGHETEFSQPDTVYLMMKDKISSETFLRLLNKVRKYYKGKFDAAFSEVDMYNNSCHSIRLKDITDLSVITEIQDCFHNEGIKFKTNRMNINGKGVIKVVKSFTLDEVERQIYLDKNDDRFGYFTIPDQLSWKLFESIVHGTRNNWSGARFDAALGCLYRHSGLQEIVRIYSNEISVEMLKELKEKFLMELKRCS